MNSGRPRNLTPIRTASPTLRRVFEIANHKNLTQKEVAALTGIHHTSVYRYRTGQELPSIMRVEELLHAMGFKITVEPIKKIT